MVLMRMERMPAGTLTLDVDIIAVRAAPERRCGRVKTVLMYILPIFAAAAAVVLLLLALSALRRKRIEGHHTVRSIATSQPQVCTNACAAVIAELTAPSSQCPRCTDGA